MKETNIVHIRKEDRARMDALIRRYIKTDPEYIHLKELLHQRLTQLYAKAVRELGIILHKGE